MTIMDSRLPSDRGEILVIGYGNTLRSDDGVGPRVAFAANGWAVPGLTSIAAHQLTPELAEPLAAAELAIFVDARLAEGGEEVEILPLESSRSGGMTGHASDPRFLLALAQALYGRHPRTWLVTVPVADLSLGERISPAAERGVAAALERIAELIRAVRG
jgi:hydrogenase maturation protease